MNSNKFTYVVYCTGNLDAGFTRAINVVDYLRSKGDRIHRYSVSVDANTHHFSANEFLDALR